MRRFNSKAGTEKVVHTMRGALEMYPGNLLIAVDSRNAFNSMNRGAFIHALSTSPFRALLPSSPSSTPSRASSSSAARTASW